MSKEILVIYQDCFMCGAPENWSELAKQTFAECEKAGIKPRKVSCFSQEGQSHALAAIQAGVKSTPFFTDGEKYASNIKDLIEAESRAQNEQDEAEPQKAKKTAKKTKKAVKEAKNGTNSAI